MQRLDNHQRRDAMATQSSAHDYQGHECSQILPSHIRKLGNRLRLLTGDSFSNLQAYCIILTGIKLFLPIDEVLEIKIEHFLPELFIVQGGRIEAVAVKVYDKKDKKSKYLFLWADHKHPDLCPMRHLLVYVYLLGDNKSGFLFPAIQELSSAPSDGVFKTHVSYESFRCTFQSTLVEALGHDVAAAFKLGPHVLKKGGYGFRIFGDPALAPGTMAWAMLKNDARHPKEKDAHKFAKDAFALRENHYFFGDPLNAVSVGKAIHLSSPNAALFMIAPYSARMNSIFQLAQSFVRDLGSFGSQRELIQRSYSYGKFMTYADARNELLQALTEQQRELFETFERLERREQLQGVISSRGPVPPPIGAGVAVPNVAPVGGTRTNSIAPICSAPSRPPKQKSAQLALQSIGKKELPVRHIFSKLESIEKKVLKLQEARKEFVNTGELTPAAKVWVCRTMQPVLSCLEKHFASDVAAFAHHWRGTFRVKFSEHCCTGKGANCHQKTKNQAS